MAKSKAESIVGSIGKRTTIVLILLFAVQVAFNVLRDHNRSRMWDYYNQKYCKEMPDQALESLMSENASP